MNDWLKTRWRREVGQRGVSLVELVVVLVVVGILGGGSLGLYRNYSSLRERARVESGLAEVAGAQKRYLVAHPVETYAALTAAKLGPYLPGGTIPVELVRAGTVVNLTINPPTAMRGGQTYVAPEF